MRCKAVLSFLEDFCVHHIRFSPLHVGEHHCFACCIRAGTVLFTVQSQGGRWSLPGLPCREGKQGRLAFLSLWVTAMRQNQIEMWHKAGIKYSESDSTALGTEIKFLCGPKPPWAYHSDYLFSQEDITPLCGWEKVLCETSAYAHTPNSQLAWLHKATCSKCFALTRNSGYILYLRFTHASRHKHIRSAEIVHTFLTLCTIFLPFHLPSSSDMIHLTRISGKE